ncbi:hypothetical protein ABVT39_015607 [Epinephelus coioides]
MFTTKTGSSLHSLYIYCQLLTDLRASVLFRLHGGVEVPECQDEQFTGRVQCDKDVLREGRLRLHVSRLRTDDSGRILCSVLTNYGRNSGRCRLNVTAARDRPEPQTPNTTRGGRDLSPTSSRPQPESRGRMGLHCGLGLTAAVLQLLMSPNLRDQQRVHNQRVHNQRVHNQRVHNQRVHKQRVHKQRVHNQRVHNQRVHNQRVHNQRVHNQRVHNQRVHKQRVHNQRVHNQRVHKQRVHKQRVHKQRVHNQRVHNQRVHNQRVGKGSASMLH